MQKAWVWPYNPEHAKDVLNKNEVPEEAFVAGKKDVDSTISKFLNVAKNAGVESNADAGASMSSTFKRAMTISEYSESIKQAKGDQQEPGDSTA